MVEIISRLLGNRPILLSNILSARKDKTVLLQTAQRIATNEDNSNSATARVLFVNGSQRKFSTNCLKSQLKFKLIGMKPSV